MYVYTYILTFIHNIVWIGAFTGPKDNALFPSYILKKIPRNPPPALMELTSDAVSLHSTAIQVHLWRINGGAQSDLTLRACYDVMTLRCFPLPAEWTSLQQTPCDLCENVSGAILQLKKPPINSDLSSHSRLTRIRFQSRQYSDSQNDGILSLLHKDEINTL